MKPSAIHIRLYFSSRTKFVHPSVILSKSFIIPRRTLITTTTLLTENDIIKRNLDAEDETIRSCYKWYAERDTKRRINNITSPSISQNYPPSTTSNTDDKPFPLGFTLSIQRSRLHTEGLGLFISKGIVKAGTICAIYPGILLRPSDPRMLFGFWNDYMIRMSDGVILDGNPRGLSAMVYRSLHRKYADGVTGYRTCDSTWLDVEIQRRFIIDDVGRGGADDDVPMMKNKWDDVVLFNCGHYVNHGKKGSNNVEYVEKIFGMDNFFVDGFGENSMCLLPYVRFDGNSGVVGDRIRGIVLVANRDIECGEELATYYDNVIPDRLS